MKTTRLILYPLLILGIACLAVPVPAAAQETTGPTIDTGVICTSVEDRAPVGADSTFAKTVGTLCCFTKITGVTGESSITHVWYWGETERARVELPVRSVSWRTYSQKAIMEHEVGAWRVEILDAEGAVLKTLRFTIEP